MSVPIGVLSAAHVHTGGFMGSLSSLPDAELVGLADDDAERGAATAERFDVPLLDADELLSRVDGVVVCSTNADHETWVDAAATAGVDVLCEKPLAPTLEQAHRIVETCEAADVRLGLCMPLRFTDAAFHAKQALADGEIGTLHAVSGTNRGRMPGSWFVDPDAAGGGACMDHTVHVVDLVHELTGERVVEVYAELDTRFHDIPVDDVNVLSMELSDGSQFILDGSWSRPAHWHTWGGASLELHGTAGTVSFDCFDQTITHTTDTGENPGLRSVFWGANTNARLVADFIDAVRNDRPPEITGADGAAAVAVVEAAYRSAERGTAVDVKY